MDLELVDNFVESADVLEEEELVDGLLVVVDDFDLDIDGKS